MKKTISSSLILTTITPTISFAEDNKENKYKQLLENVKKHIKSDAEMFMAWNHLKNKGDSVYNGTDFTPVIDERNEEYIKMIDKIYQMVIKKCNAIENNNEAVTEVFFHHLNAIYSTLRNTGYLQIGIIRFDKDGKEFTSKFNDYSPEDASLILNIRKEFEKIAKIEEITAENKRSHVDCDNAFKEKDFFEIKYEKPEYIGDKNYFWDCLKHFSALVANSALWGLGMFIFTSVGVFLGDALWSAICNIFENTEILCEKALKAEK